MSNIETENQDWLRRCRISREDILQRLSAAEADLADARRDLPAEWSFNLAFTAVLSLCTLLVHASGCPVEGDEPQGAIAVLPLVFGEARQADAAYLSTCLELRQRKSAQPLTPLSLKQANELIRFAEDLYLDVLEWLRRRDADLVADSSVSFLRSRNQSLVVL